MTAAWLKTSPLMRRPHVGRPGLVVALAVCNIGNAIPYGLASGVRSNTVNAAEWALSACYAVAAILMIARILGWKGARSGWAWVVTAGCWAASASYAAWLPHATVRARIGIGLIFAGIALAALFAHAREQASHLPWAWDRADIEGHP
ncbi:MAG: hypothetical protein J2P28_11895 [Actinobacteria bacterium]|nr:hypothetical protein [Actinomycetota bacterium]